MKRLAMILALASVAATPAMAKKTYSHQKYFEHYEGTKTCLKCHTKQAKSFFQSVHYQWKAPAAGVVKAENRSYGKINLVNDYCTNPLPNWIGKITNDNGKVLEAGCSKCHAGFGKIPSEKMTREQLENIDCLICHASGYRRDLYRNQDGSWEWRPILWKNRVGLDSVSKRISKPTRTMCLRCHAGSGGGPNYKRGDLEYRLTDCDSDFDVHMASNGNDFQCIDCHITRDHKIAGHGADLTGDQVPGVRVSCDNDDCHGTQPHEAEILNHHTRRVFCTACHIPEYAKEDPTNLRRDWSHGRYSEEKEKYTYEGEFGKHVTPVLAWWNGKTVRMQLPRKPVRTNAAGEIEMAVPVGSKNDPDSKLYAFKLYHAVMPVMDGTGWLLPIETGYFYKTGDMDAAARRAGEEFYHVENFSYNWKPTVRYQGLFHEVAPAKNARRCLDCHGPSGLDWKALGYNGDPMLSLLHSAHR